MGRRTKSADSDATLLPKEVGTRLKQVRLKAGLTHGRKLLSAMRRTRRTRPVWRQEAMAKLDTWAAEHKLPPEPFANMKQAVIALFADTELRGELD